MSLPQCLSVCGPCPEVCKACRNAHDTYLGREVEKLRSTPDQRLLRELLDYLERSDLDDLDFGRGFARWVPRIKAAVITPHTRCPSAGGKDV